MTVKRSSLTTSSPPTSSPTNHSLDSDNTLDTAESVDQPISVPKTQLRPRKFKPLTLKSSFPSPSPRIAENTPAQTCPTPSSPRPVLPKAHIKPSLPFVSPVGLPSSSSFKPATQRELAADQRSVQLLKQAVQILSSDGQRKEMEMTHSIGRLKSAGREVAQLLWDSGLSVDPASKEGNPFANEPYSPPSSLTYNHPSFKPFFDDEADGGRKGEVGSTTESSPDFPAADEVMDRVLRTPLLGARAPFSAVGYLKELDSERAADRACGVGVGAEKEETAGEWTVGEMLRKTLKVDPVLCEPPPLRSVGPRA